MQKLLNDLDSYLAVNTRITTDKTRKQYRCTMRQFASVSNATKPKHVTDEALGAFVVWLRREGYAEHTVSQKLAYLKAYANHRARLGKCQAKAQTYAA